MKEKSEASARKLIEAAHTYNDLSDKFNKLKYEADDKGNENVRLKKKLEERRLLILLKRPRLRRLSLRLSIMETGP